ncbi:carbonic anhydrase [Wilcoxina mikolae CBS 423.85]|nr:carbonic anhydrase [Wilcoxina mikolae CBS 423.85]
MRSILLLLASVTAATACLYPRAEDPAHSWNYDGLTGPVRWHALAEENKICATGKHQSPINIDTKSIRLSSSAELNYPSSGDFNLTNNGHTVQATPEGTYTATLRGEKYKLVNFHFHTSSEHRVDGMGYPLEAHFVHSSVKTGALAVVGVFFEVDSRQGVSFFHKLPFRELKDKNDSVIVKKVDLQSITKRIQSVYTYSGSLTTPPCTEQVSWFVSDAPLTISVKQFRLLNKALGFNSRFTQGKPGEQNVLEAACDTKH